MHIAGSYAIGLATVGLALAAFYIIARAWKAGRFGLPSQKRLISVVETAILNQHAVLQIVRVGTRYYAITGAAAHITVIAELAAPEIEDFARSLEVS